MTPAEREAQAAEMRAQLADGWTHAEVAHHHGVSVSTVRRRIDPKVAAADTAYNQARNDTVRNPAPPVRASNAAATADMWADSIAGLTHQEIADKHGLARATVSGRLRAYARSLPDTDREMLLARCLEQLETVQAPLLRLATGRDLPPAYSHGRQMLHPDGTPVPDHNLQVAAARALLTCLDRVAKFVGLDAPAKTELAVVEAASEAAKAQAARAQAYLDGSVSGLADAGVATPEA